MEFDSILQQLINPTQDLGGAPRPDDVKDIAKLILGGGRASVEGTPLFGGAAPNNDTARALQLGPGRLFETGGRVMNLPVQQGPAPTAAVDPTADAIADYERKVGYAVRPVGEAAPVAPRMPLRPNLQEMLDTADQIANSLTTRTGSVTQTLLPNPYGPGSYDPNDAKAVAEVKAQGVKVDSLAKAREMIQQVSRDPLLAARAPQIIDQILQGVGVLKSDAAKEGEKARAIAKGKAEGEAEGRGPDQSGDLIAEKVARYEMPLPSGFALRSPYWQGVMQKAVEINPNFDSTQYKARQDIRTDFAKGKAAVNIRSLNTAVDHLDTLAQAGEELQNSDNQLWNKIRNKSLDLTGDKRVTKFKNAATAVESELAAVFKGTGATDQEIKQWRENLSNAQSPAQIKEAIGTAVKLMEGRLGALDEQWRQTMGVDRDIPILSKKSREILDKMGLSSDTLDPVQGEKPGVKAEALPPGAPQGAVLEPGKTFQGKPAYKLPNGKYWIP